MTTALDGPLARLRAATAARHRDLESTPVAKALIREDLTRPAYAAVLARWLAAWSVLEDRLAPPPSRVPPAYTPRSRAALGARELRELGGAPQALGPELVARFPAASGAAWFGIAYVVQGSALGGARIAAHLDRVLGVDRPPSFFAPGDPGLAAAWRGWTAWLDEAIGPDEVPLVVAAAEGTFDALHAAFSTPP